MPEEASQRPQPYMVQVEQAIATIITCRTVVKYNSMLNEEQKNELFGDIDTALKFLRDDLIDHASAKMQAAEPQAQPMTIVPANPAPEEEAYTYKGDDEQTLHLLYRMYHTYLNMKQENNISMFVTRFNEVMSTLNEVQALIERGGPAYTYPAYISVEDPLQRVRSFIADLYYVFMEFVRALSNALQDNDAHVDTEELASLRRQYSEEEKQERQCIALLSGMYETHHQLNERKGTTNKRISDTMAFLEFLAESLASEFNRREEIVAQLNEAIKLLSDLSHLLSGYESAVSALLRRS